MRTFRIFPIGTIGIAVALAFGATAWLWIEYRNEIRMHEEVLVVRGEGLLTALEAGILSHRRMGVWFQENIQSVLEETATSPGILGLAVFREDGSAAASVGEASGSLKPVEAPEWTENGLLVGSKFTIPSSEAEPGGGRGQRGWRWRESNPPGSSSGEEILGRSFILTALMDGTASRKAIHQDARRFTLSLTIAWLAIFLGLAAYVLHQRKKNLASELAMARERAQHLEELNRLAAGLAHETKNPLNLIRGMAQSCLNRSGGSDPVHDTARRIIDEADRLVGRINGFLAYSKPKTVDLKTVDMDVLVNQVIFLFRDEADAKGVELKTQIEGLTVAVDAEMFRQILVNLLTNSLAATNTGGMISVTLQKGPSGSAILEVCDTGCGIPAEDLPHLCEPYFSRRQGGTGLGLSIVKQLVEAHGWIMSIDSQPGKGTQVHIDGLAIVESK